MTPWIIVTFGILVVYVFLAHNKLQRYRVECSNSWSHIDIQLERRHDLIPRLVETVRAALEHESDILTRITEARAEARALGDRQARLRAEAGLSSLVSTLVGCLEQVPSLKTWKNALLLQEELEATENRIAYTRHHYNDIVSNYNTLCEQLPTSLVAKLFGFEQQHLFRAPDESKALIPVGFQAVDTQTVSS